jgi:hypothetical protein
MKKHIFAFVFCIFTMLLSCGNDLTNIADVVGKYIKKNELPITIGEEIKVYNDFNMTLKTNFQIFMLDLINTLSNDISEGNFNDKTIENLIEAQRILTGFYDYCTNNNYELAIIFSNTYNEKGLLIDYFEYYNYNLTFYNNWVIFDNNTHYTELKNLIGILLQIGDIARNNLANFLHDWNGKDANIYKRIVLRDGIIETIDMDHNEYFDIVFEVELMNICYFLIGDIVYLFKIKGYDLDIYVNTWAEIMEKNKELETFIDNYNNNDAKSIP